MIDDSDGVNLKTGLFLSICSTVITCKYLEAKATEVQSECERFRAIII